MGRAVSMNTSWNRKMNMTRKRVVSVQVKLMGTWFSPARSATSGRVTPTFAADGGTSLIVTVRVPPGAPFCRSAAAGALPAASLSTADAADGGGGVAAGAAAGAAAWPKAPALMHRLSARIQRHK